MKTTFKRLSIENLQQVKGGVKDGNAALYTSEGKKK